MPAGEYRGGGRGEGLAERETRLTKELEEEKEGAAAARGGEGEGGEGGGDEEPRRNTKKERELLAVRVRKVNLFFAVSLLGMVVPGMYTGTFLCFFVFCCMCVCVCFVVCSS